MRFNIDPGLRWYVVRAKPNKTLKAAIAIREAGFECYCPRARIERWNKRRRHYVIGEQPAMDPYIFVGFAPENRQFGMVSSLDEVLDFLGVDGEPCHVPHRIVLAVLLAETEMVFDDTPASRRLKAEELDRRFPKGMAVKLIRDISNVLSMMDGKVLGTNGLDKVQVAWGAIKSWVSEAELKAA